MTWDDAERLEGRSVAALALAAAEVVAAIEDAAAWLAMRAAMYGMIALAVVGWGVDRVRRWWKGE
jgi:Zn-dependent membrane protease YugP